MQVDKFVEELWLCAPPVESLEGRGLSPAEAASFRESFVCKKRSDSAGYSDSLLELIASYDTSKLEIGTVTFSPYIVEAKRGWHIGYFEIDPIVIDRSTGEVLVEDEAQEGYVMWECAESGGKFLDALLLAGCFLGRCFYDEQLASDQIARHEQADICTKAAGGTRYSDFYLVLLGCE